MGRHLARRSSQIETDRPKPVLRGCSQLLRAPGFAVLLDLRLGKVLVVAADHPVNRRRGVLAARDRAKLAWRFLSQLRADGSIASHKSAVHRGTSTGDDLLFDQRRETRGEIVNQGWEIQRRKITARARRWQRSAF